MIRAQAGLWELAAVPVRGGCAVARDIRIGRVSGLRGRAGDGLPVSRCRQPLGGIASGWWWRARHPTSMP